MRLKIVFILMLTILGMHLYTWLNRPVEAASAPYTVYVTQHNCVFISNAIPGGVAIHVVPKTTGPYINGDNGC